MYCSIMLLNLLFVVVVVDSSKQEVHGELGLGGGRGREGRWEGQEGRWEGKGGEVNSDISFQ